MEQKIVRMSKGNRAGRFLPFYLFTSLLLLTSCFGSKMMTANGGEVTGTGGKAFVEPTPYGMEIYETSVENA